MNFASRLLCSATPLVGIIATRMTQMTRINADFDYDFNMIYMMAMIKVRI